VMLPRMAFVYFMRRSKLIMLQNRWSVPGKSGNRTSGPYNLKEALTRVYGTKEDAY